MLYKRLQNDIIEAMKTGNKDKKDALKQVQIKAQAYVKENKTEMTEEVVTDAIRKELKQLGQTKDSLKGKEESALYHSTIYKMDLLNGYLPAQLSREDCLLEVRGVLIALPSEMPKGAKIGAVMKALKGKADNTLIKECAEEILR